MSKELISHKKTTAFGQRFRKRLHAKYQKYGKPARVVELSDCSHGPGAIVTRSDGRKYIVQGDCSLRRA